MTLRRPALPLRLARARIALIATLAASAASAQTGVSDDRVSLPDGPGSLDGMGDNASFSPSKGSFSWAVPFSVPEGFAGLTPSLGLTYDSGAGASVAGVGWSFDVPSIERMTSRGVPRYDEDDLFAAGGSAQLVRTEEGEPATYRARFEGGFSRYRWYARGDGSEGYWTEESPDGTVAYYGADRTGALVESARVRGPDGVFRYLLVEKVDVWGASISYEYVSYGGLPLLDFVGWVHETDGTPRFAASFDYEARDDKISDAAPGFNHLLSYRLSGAHIYSGGTEIRSYSVFYEDAATSRGKSRIERVEQRGRDGTLYPAVPTFSYSRSLGGVCDGTDCEAPTLTDLGTLGINLQAGNATLIDLNGDALPDVLETPVGAPHRIHLAQLGPDGTHTFAAGTPSALGAQTNSTQLSSPYVQVLDYDGDGFVDLLNAATGEVFVNKGAGDWDSVVALGGSSTGDLPDFGEDFEIGTDTELAHIRFFDYDNDRLIDVMRSDSVATTVHRNEGDNGYVADPDVQAIGSGFEEDGLELADINGDGLLDPVVLRPGELSHRIHLGRGRWAGWVTLENLPVTVDNLPFASLEDLDGDGLDDLVIVEAGTVSYALNRNAEGFDPMVSLTTASGVGIPVRDATTTVLFADMNANGSNDVVWVTSDGAVTYLEIFPVRPNLLARVDNGLGLVTAVEFGTAVAERARDAGAGWDLPLPTPTLVVTAVDSWTAAPTPELEVHDRRTLAFTGGYYDGQEKQFAGFARSVQRTEASENELSGRVESDYDVGDGGRPHFAGLELETRLYSDDVLVRTSRQTFEECPLTGVDNAGQPWPVLFVCSPHREDVYQEGRPAAEWVTVATDTAYDGYGRVTLVAEEGVVTVGGGACAACALPAGAYGEPCGAQCLGDETYTETTWADPDDNVGGRWLLDLEVTSRTWVEAGGRERVTHTYYDGAPFVGLPLGQTDRGDAVRVEAETEDPEKPFALARHRYDTGLLVESLLPGGSASDEGFRKRYEYDDVGLRITRTLFELNAGAGTRVLYRDYTYDEQWNKVASATEWTVAGDTPAGSVRYGYDEFGRISWLAEAGDSEQSPTNRFEYELGAPFSRVTLKAAREPGGPYDLERTTCYDGFGREAQRRQRTGDGTWHVSGFATYNRRGEPVRAYEPYTSSESACEDATPPTAYEEYFYDGLGRGTGTTRPDGARTRVEYGPRIRVQYGEDDLDEDAPGFDTPDVFTADGLGRTTRVERRVAAGGPAAVHQLYYDDLGELAGYLDPEGNEKRQRRDLLGRVVEVVDPDSGTWAWEYDDAGNPVRQTDPTGRVVVRAFDDLDRIVEEYVEGDREATLVEAFWDVHPDCPGMTCSNTAGRLAGSRYQTGELGTVEERQGYDERGHLRFSSRQVGGVGYRTEHEFNNVGQLTAMTMPDGRRVELEVDALGRVTAIPGYVTSIEHNDDSFVTAWTLANGVRTTLGYNANKDIVSIDAATSADAVVALALERNVVGQVLSITDAVGEGMASSSRVLTYDGLTRLIGAEVGEGDSRETLSWSFDDLERIASVTSSDPASPAHLGAFSYGGLPRAVMAAGDIDLDYDAAGRAVQRGPLALSWDGFGRLAAVEGGDVDKRILYTGARKLAELRGASQQLHVTPSYEVNDGVARLKISVAGRVVVQEDSAALLTDVIGDEDGDGAITAADGWARAGDARRLTLRAAARALLLDDDGLDRAWLHGDQNGSVIAVTDDEGAVTERFSYYPFGQVRYASAVHTERAAFAGAAHDETGLLDFGTRSLMPELGRFTAPDPTFLTLDDASIDKLTDAAGVYTYAGNDPVSAVDYEGRYEWTKGKVALALGGALVLGAAAVAATVTGVLPAVAIGVGATALSLGLAGAIAGGVSSLVSSIILQCERLRAVKQVTGASPTRMQYAWSVGSVLINTALGTAAGGLTGGVSILFSAVRSAISVAVYRDKIHPNDGAVAAVTLGIASALTGDLSSVEGLAKAATSVAISAGTAAYEARSKTKTLKLQGKNAGQSFSSAVLSKLRRRQPGANPGAQAATPPAATPPSSPSPAATSSSGGGPGPGPGAASSSGPTLKQRVSQSFSSLRKRAKSIKP